MSSSNLRKFIILRANGLFLNWIHSLTSSWEDYDLINFSVQSLRKLTGKYFLWNHFKNKIQPYFMEYTNNRKKTKTRAYVNNSHVFSFKNILEAVEMTGTASTPLPTNTTYSTACKPLFVFCFIVLTLLNYLINFGFCFAIHYFYKSVS